MTIDTALHAQPEGEAVNFANYLYSIVDQKAHPKELTSYNEIVRLIDTARKEKARRGAYAYYSIEYNVVIGRLWWLNLPEYENLTNSELAIFLDIFDQVKFSAVGGPHSVEKTLRDLFAHERTSDELKFVLSCSYFAHEPAAVWLCNYKGGENIPKLVSVLTGGMKVNGQRKPAPIAVKYILVNCIQALSTEAEGYSFLTKLNPEVVTPSFFRQALELAPLASYPNLYNVGLAFHARRLYDLDEEVPDEWVLHAVK